jgi:chromosome segregation ATPase
MEADALQREIDDKKQVSANQNRVLDAYQEEMQKQWQKKLKEVQNEIKVAREKNRELTEKVTKIEKNVNKNHEFIVVTKEKIAVLAAKIKEKKNKKKDEEMEEGQSPSENNVEELEKEIQSLNKQKRELERKHLDNLRRLKEEYSESETKYNKLSLLVRQKEKEYRINMLKMKELKLIADANGEEMSKPTFSPGKILRFSVESRRKSCS